MGWQWQSKLGRCLVSWFTWARAVGVIWQVGGPSPALVAESDRVNVHASGVFVNIPRVGVKKVRTRVGLEVPLLVISFKCPDPRVGVGMRLKLRVRLGMGVRMRVKVKG